MWPLNDPQFSPTPHPALFSRLSLREGRLSTLQLPLYVWTWLVFLVLIRNGGGGGSLLSLSLSSRSRLIAKSKPSVSRKRRVSVVPTDLPFLLLAKTEVLALALLFSVAIFVLSRIAAIAAKHR
jgi:hypothetical protein